MGLTLMEGNEVIAWAAYEAGCRFFAGYPITPATTIYNSMLRILPPEGGIVLQGEDEIASLGYCLGASMAGWKAMTATSGPGISLYSENISFAIGSEIPVVIVNVQRLGPSTGSATKGADGDIQFMRWGSSGGLPVIVLAPADVADCFPITMHAFNLAEQYRCPVFIASNKEIGLTGETVNFAELERVPIINRLPAQEGMPFVPFRPAPDSGVPYFLPIGAKTVVRQTSSTHGENGYITTDPAAIRAANERLERKLTANADRFSYYHEEPVEGARTLVVTYGITSRAARLACRELNKTGRKASLLVLKTLYPVPESVICRAADSIKRVLVVEMNQGQYVLEVARILNHHNVEFTGGMDGKLISPSQIMEAVID
ncbi:MAG: pyruvate flavodoxin/ferredoxin oxidoreductase [Desulfomonile tiedjei]|nr:pyruvate flavodoxin/ferredoxin oxidoreductase [Desulfomonile tiedjei]